MSDLKWSPERHDKAVTKLQETEGRKKAAELIVKVYESWKRRFKKKPKTQPEVIQELYRLRDMVGDACKHTPGMADWREFTMNLIEQKISDVLLTECGKLNVFTEKQLPTPDGSLSIPQFHAFSILDEFLAIPFFNNFKKRDDFVGFVRDDRIIYAMYNDGEISLAGHTLSIKGIERLPTRQRVAGGITEAEDTKGNTPGIQDGAEA